MNNDKNQNDSQHSKSEKDEYKEEIPLWLQGLKEHEDEDTNPIEIEGSSVDTWVKEISEDTPETPDIETGQPHETASESDANPETYPDWLSELSEVDPAKPAILDPETKEPTSRPVEDMKEALTEGEEPQELERSQSQSEQVSDEVDQASEDLPPIEEQEIELTKPADKEIPESIDENITEELSEDDELPPWLQEMIAESPETPPEKTQMEEETNQEAEARLADEPTEPVDTSEEPLAVEDLDSDAEITEEEIEEDEEEIIVEQERFGEELEVEDADIEEDVIEEENIKEQESFSEEREVKDADDEEDIIEEEERIDEEELIIGKQEFEDAEINEPEVEEDFAEEPAEIQETADADEIEEDFAAEPSPSEWIPEDLIDDDLDFEEEPLPPQMPATTIEGDTRPIVVSEESPPEKQVDEAEEVLSAHYSIPEPDEAEPEQVEEAEEEPPLPPEGEMEVPEPVQVQPEQEEVEEITKPLPEDLVEAKKALSNGELDEAVRVISNSENASSHSQEVQSWLVEASNSKEITNVDFWELLGDIALDNHQADLALDAYTKAIQSLINHEA